MARTALTVQSVVRSGLADSLSAANADGHSIVNEGKKTWLEVLNGGAGSINVTIQTPGTIDGLAVADRVIAVGAGARKKIGPFPVAEYNQSDGAVYVDFSDVASVTVGAFIL